MTNSVDLDEVAHNEPPHQELHCLQIQLFASLVLKELKLQERTCWICLLQEISFILFQQRAGYTLLNEYKDKFRLVFLSN